MKKTKVEQWVHDALFKDGFTENEYGVISASFANGNGSMNLTYVIAEYAENYAAIQNAELLSEIEHLKGEQQVLIETINSLTPYKKEGI